MSMFERSNRCFVVRRKSCKHFARLSRRQVRIIMAVRTAELRVLCHRWIPVSPHFATERGSHYFGQYQLHSNARGFSSLISPWGKTFQLIMWEKFYCVHRKQCAVYMQVWDCDEWRNREMVSCIYSLLLAAKSDSHAFHALQTSSLSTTAVFLPWSL